MSPVDPEDWISTFEAAQISGLHPNYIRRLVRSGEVIARRWGNALMISKVSILDYVASARKKGGKPGPKSKKKPLQAF